MPTLSVVVPCFNEEETLPIFLSELDKVFRTMTNRWPELNLEAVLVDDGSTDKTLQTMQQTAKNSQYSFAIRWFSLSRNFGKEAALYAGLSEARGDYVATMDADMQDPPSLLPTMYELIRTGEYDNIATRRKDRKGEPAIRSWFAHRFYSLIRRISNADIVDGARDSRLMNRTMVDAVLSVGEYNRFSKGIYGWVGFRTKWIAYENIDRAAGKTKWNFLKLFIYALDGITAFSTLPLVIASMFGLFFCLLAFLLIIFIVVRTFMFGDPVAGWPSTICIIMLIGGIQLMCIGVLGQYLAKTYLETKCRPLYLICEQGASATPIATTSTLSSTLTNA